VRPTQQDFRGLILRRSTRGHAALRAIGDRGSVTEIGQHYMTRSVNENIGRCEVAVDDIGSMQRGYRIHLKVKF
jgi:hypothetical protein